MTGNPSYSFGEYTLDLARGALLKSGADVKLRPKSFEVLRILVERHGRLVTKDELLSEVWGRTVVTEGSIVQCLLDIRRAIGDEAQQKIKTVPRRGYIFDVPVVVADTTAAHHPDNGRPAAGDQGAPAPANSSWSTNRRSQIIRRVALTAMFASLILVAVWWGIESRGIDESHHPDTPGQPIARNSIAVLPFANMMGEPDSDYLCDGFSEEILNRLATFPELQVIARTSSFAFKDSALETRKLAGLLGVRYLLQGSVRKEGASLRIAAQLVDDGGLQIWSRTYDRETGRMFALQQEIAEDVATQIAPKVASKFAAAQPPMPHFDAYREYLIGRQLLDKRTPRDFELAEARFRKAINIDPRYAGPHAELGILWSRAFPDRAQQSIDRAVQLDPTLARAHAAQGLVLEARDPPDRKAAEDAYRKALSLDSNMVDASNWLANLLRGQGRDAEALAIMERAARIDPLAPPLMNNLAMTYAERGDTARAEQALRRLLDAPGPQPHTLWTLKDLLQATGRLVDANAIAKQLVITYVDSSGRGDVYPILAATYATLGMWDSADYWVDRFEREPLTRLYIAGPMPAELLRRQGRMQAMVAAARIERSSASDAGNAWPPLLHYGTLQALAGDYRGAINTLAPELGAESPLMTDVDLDANARHALAWSYQKTGSPGRAKRILDALDRYYSRRQAEGWLHLSSDIAMYAQNAALQGDENQALERLRQAVDAGWRDYYSLINDPRWSSLVDDQRFEGLMAYVKKDVDAQRAELERLEKTDDTRMRVDSLLANRTE